jgi:hypothetical protein
MGAIYKWGGTLWLPRISVMEFFKLVGTSYEVPCRIPCWIRVVTFPMHSVFQGLPVKLAGQYFFDFPLVVTVDLNW